MRKYIPKILLLGILGIALGSPQPYSSLMCSGIIFIGIAAFVGVMFRACSGLARLTWAVSAVLFLCAGSWAYYDEFKICSLTDSNAAFEIKHQVSLGHGFYYGFLSFIGVWAIYFIVKWYILKIRESNRN